MNDRRLSRVAATALCLGVAALYVIWMLTAVQLVGTDAGLYFSEQMKAGILPEAGVSEAQLRSLDERLADYLRGSSPALEDDPPFNAREMTHMRDCFELFELLRGVRRRLIPWAVLLIVGGSWLLRDRKRIRLCAWLSPLILLVPLGGFALFAALDFDAAFTLFHKILFRNDLWLLDPATDLLIRICPESMFMDMGIGILVWGLGGIAAISIAAALLTRLWPGEKGVNTWKTTTRPGPAPRQYDFRNRSAR